MRTHAGDDSIGHEPLLNRFCRDPRNQESDSGDTVDSGDT